MRRKPPLDLGRRERQIMEIVYELGAAGVSDVLRRLHDPPSYSSVRAMLNVLERKGHLKHKREKTRYLYMPTVPREKARSRALDHLLKTFFDGSPTKAVAALLDSSTANMSDDELDELIRLINKARREGR